MSIWPPEGFDHFNEPDPRQERSLLDTLRDTGAFVERIASRALNELEERDEPYIVAFFQLPRPVFAGDERFFLPAKEKGIVIEYQFFPIRMEVGKQGRIQVIPDDGADDFISNATQVVAFVPLWQKRAEHFQRYENCFWPNGMKNDVVVESKDSWIGGRPLRAKDFEINICQRLVRELVFSSKRFLKAYSTITRSSYISDDWLYGYFLMPFPGRVVCAAPPKPLIAYAVERLPSSTKVLVDAEKLRRAVPHTYRVYSRFEKQIFAMRDLSEQGYHALATVGGMSLIEWILRINIPATVRRGRRFNGLEKLIDYFDEHAISTDTKLKLHEIRRLRNTIVHLGEFSDFRGTRAHEVLELGVDHQVNSADAEKTLELAWSLFQDSNSGRLSLSA